jgi:hypothetical protein
MTVLVDVAETVHVRKIDIQGKLQFEDSGDRILHADYILNFGGVFEIGTSSEPFTHVAQVVLHGDFDSDALQIDEVHHLGAAVLANFGTLNIFGPERVSWVKLNATANAGDTTITVSASVDWVAGETILLPSTDFSLHYHEQAVVASVSGNIVTLTSPLMYSHYGYTQTIGGEVVDTRGEVALLSRNIRIQGSEDNTPGEPLGAGYGCHVLFGKLVDWGFQGSGTLFGAELYNCGQGGGSPRGSLKIQNLQGQDNFAIRIEDCSIHYGHNSGLDLEDSQYVTLHNNVWEGMFGESGIEGVGATNNIFTNNIFGGFRELLRQTTEHIAYDLCAVRFDTGSNTFHNNIIAGSEGMGWCVQLDQCTVSDANLIFRDNAVHSAVHGMVMRYQHSSGIPCVSLRYFSAWKNSHVGIFSASEAQVQVSYAHVVENFVGIVLWSADTTWDASTRLEHSIVSGKSAEMNLNYDSNICHLTDPYTFFFEDKYIHRGDDEWVDAECYGVLTGEFNTKGDNIVILRPKETPVYRHKKKYKPNANGVSYVDDVTFANFGAFNCRDGGCSAIATADLAHDRLAPMHFSNIVWEDTVE